MDASLVYAMPITPEVTLAFTYPEGFDLRAIRQETANLRDIFIIGRYAIRMPQKIFHPVSPLRTMNSSMWLLLFPMIWIWVSLPGRITMNHTGFWNWMKRQISRSLPNWMRSSFHNPLQEWIPALTSRSPIPGPFVFKRRFFLRIASVLAAGLSPEAPLPDLSSVIEENVHEFQEEPSPHLPADTTLKLPWEETTPQYPIPRRSMWLRKMLLSSTLAAQEALLRELPTPRRSSTFYHCVIVPNSPSLFSHP